MSRFSYRSFIEIFILSLCTLGLYWLYWDVSTKRELVRAGGKIPNAFLVVVPIANLYFWYKYAQAYAKIVKKSQTDADLLICFLVPTFGTYFISLFTSFIFRSYSGLSITFNNMNVQNIHIQTNELGIFFGPGLWLLNVFLVTLLTYTVFQKGFNEYKD